MGFGPHCIRLILRDRWPLRLTIQYLPQAVQEAESRALAEEAMTSTIAEAGTGSQDSRKWYASIQYSDLVPY